MDMTGLGKIHSWIALSAAIAVASCGSEPSRDPLEVATSGPPRAVKIQFGAHVDPSAGTFEVTHAEAITGNGLAPLVVVQDNVPGAGPANTVELVTTSVGFGMAACGAPSSFCGSVTLRSFYGQALVNTFVHLLAITPATGHAPLNSDPATMGLDNTFGLWGYGPLAANGGSSSRLWSFGDDGTAFTITGEVQADIVSDAGCADGAREGWTNTASFLNIAGCSGGWNVPGLIPAAAPSCGLAAGDDGANPNGTGCGSTDLCGPGWHVCAGRDDVNTHGGCAGATQVGDPPLFFATRQPSLGAGAGCNIQLGTNDIYGCGNLGDAPNANCAPLDRFSNQGCFALGIPPWLCGMVADGEGANVTKNAPERGGVACCRD